MFYVVRMLSCVVLRRVVCCTRCAARVLAGLILDGRPIHAHGRRPSSTDTLDSLGALFGAKWGAIPSRPERKTCTLKCPSAPVLALTFRPHTMLPGT